MLIDPLEYQRRQQLRVIPAIYPCLPNTEKITPYLKRIDSNQWYCNHGPLVQELETKLASLLGPKDTQAVCTASGTSGIIALIKAIFEGHDGECIIPSWSFSATFQAISCSHLTPRVVDVNRKTWSLDIDTVDSMCQRNKQIKCILLVSPFGAPLQYHDWQMLAKRHSVQVIVDAAGAFDVHATFKNNDFTLPTVISLHATKPFGIGEGGIILAKDNDLIHRVRKVCNFGFNEQKQSDILGLNAKMSEFQAAVGLAMYDAWPSCKLQFRQKLIHYLTSIESLPLKSISEASWFSSTFNVQLPQANAEQCIAYLKKNGVDARQWWRQGLHRQTAFTQHCDNNMVNTDHLAESVVGLPFYKDMAIEDIDFVVQLLRKFLSKTVSVRCF